MTTHRAGALRVPALLFLAIAGAAACEAPVGSQPASSSPASAAPSLASSSPVPASGQPVTTVPPASEPAVPSVPPLPIEVLEQGFTAFPDDQGGLASFGAVLRNPNAGWALQRAQVAVDVLDAGGARVGIADVVVTILPGQTVAIAGQIAGAGDAATLVVTPPADETAFLPRAAADQAFEVSDLATVRSGTGWRTTGTLTSRFAATETFVELVALFRDANGAILGGSTGAVQSIDPGASVEFEIHDGSPYAAVAGTEVWWQLNR